MKDIKLTFNKSQHLCGETTISQLFREGKAFLVFPLRVVYRVMPREIDGHIYSSPILGGVPEGGGGEIISSSFSKKRPAVRVLTSVPKKQFKHAVDRNRFKRLIRESYRLQQHELNEVLDSNGLVMDVAFTAVHNQIPKFDYLKGRMGKILQLLKEQGTRSE